MPVLIAWIVFCFFYLTIKQEGPLYSIIAEVVLVGAAGFFVYGFGWVYQIFWSNISKKSLILKVYRSLWWPVSPLIFVFGGELEEVGILKSAVFSVVAIACWAIFNEENYRIFQKVIKQNEQDAMVLQKLELRRDLWWFDAIYWGSLSWHLFV